MLTSRENRFLYRLHWLKGLPVILPWLADICHGSRWKGSSSSLGPPIGKQSKDPDLDSRSRSVWLTIGLITFYTLIKILADPIRDTEDFEEERGAGIAGDGRRRTWVIFRINSYCRFLKWIIIDLWLNYLEYWAKRSSNAMNNNTISLNVYLS